MAARMGASAFSSVLITRSRSWIDPEQTKSFLLFFSLKDKALAFTTVRGGGIALDLPRVIEVEVYYWLKDVGKVKGAKLRITAKDWLFPEKPENVTVLGYSNAIASPPNGKFGNP